MKAKSLKALSVLLKTISQEELKKNQELKKKVAFLQKYLSRSLARDKETTQFNKA
jgi:hypothetical protein